jgi:hypothetical protein
VGRRSKKPSRLILAKRRRAAHKAERYITDYHFPSHIEKRVRRKYPSLANEDWVVVEKGLREWFVCCAWRGNRVLGMPSRLVDDAWHEFILDSVSYVSFCEAVFGGYLHHTPDETMGTPMPDALADTVRAWDRSEMGDGKESTLWDLDARLGIVEPLGMDPGRLHSARTRIPYVAASGWACAGGFLSEGDGGACSAGAECSTGSCGAGGGCGGGGCGGGSS